MSSILGPFTRRSNAWGAEADRLSLLDREARVATAEERVDAYGDDIAAVKEDLNRRMEFLEVIGEALPEDLKVAGSVSESATEAAETVEKVSAAFPEAAALARIEARQLALVEGLTQYADWRSQRAANALRKLGLDPGRVFETHPRFGNTVSASLPLGLAVAEKEGRLERGMQVLLLMGSAGVTTGLGSLEY